MRTETLDCLYVVADTSTLLVTYDRCIWGNWKPQALLSLAWWPPDAQTTFVPRCKDPHKGSPVRTLKTDHQCQWERATGHSNPEWLVEWHCMVTRRLEIPPVNCNAMFKAVVFPAPGGPNMNTIGQNFIACTIVA